MEYAAAVCLEAYNYTLAAEEDGWVWFEELIIPTSSY